MRLDRAAHGRRLAAAPSRPSQPTLAGLGLPPQHPGRAENEAEVRQPLQDGERQGPCAARPPPHCSRTPHRPLIRDARSRLDGYGVDGETEFANSGRRRPTLDRSRQTWAELGQVRTMLSDSGRFCVNAAEFDQLRTMPSNFGRLSTHVGRHRPNLRRFQTRIRRDFPSLAKFVPNLAKIHCIRPSLNQIWANLDREHIQIRQHSGRA